MGETYDHERRALAEPDVEVRVQQSPANLFAGAAPHCIRSMHHRINKQIGPVFFQAVMA